MSAVYLLLRPDKAGDALKSLPVVRALRERFPTAQWHILCSEHNFSIFSEEPGVQAHLLPARWKSMKGATLLAGLQQRGFPARFDRAVNLLCDPFADAEGLLRAMPAARRYTVPPREATSDSLSLDRVELPDGSPAGRDETLNIAWLVSRALDTDIVPDVGRFSAAPRLSVSDHQEALEKMGAKRGPWLGFCPFAGTSQRTHPLRRWEGFLPKVTRSNGYQKFFLFGVPSDYARLERLRARCDRPDDIELAFPSSFRALGAYLLRLDGVVAVDSGPLHLALAQGVKSLGVLSGGDAERWFARSGKQDLLIRRGIFNRYPTVFEMQRAYRKWSAVPEPAPEPAVSLAPSEA